MVAIHGLSKNIVHFLCRFAVLMWLACDIMWHKLLLRYRLLHWRAADIHNVFGHTSRVRPHAQPPEVRHCTLLFLLPHTPSFDVHCTTVVTWRASLWYYFSAIPSSYSPFLCNHPTFLCSLSASSNSPVCVSSDHFVQSLTSFRTERVTRDNTQLFCVFIDNCKLQTYLMLWTLRVSDI